MDCGRGVGSSWNPPVTTAPSVAVVIASTTPGERLSQTLDAVLSGLGDADDRPDETLVVIPAHVRGFGPVIRDRPTLRVIEVAEPATIPHLYAAGLGSARSDCVAMTNDGFVPAPGWVRAVRTAHAGRSGEALVVGGAIALPVDAGLLERAVYWAEYGAFAPPCAAGPVAHLPGANVSYNRAAVRRLAPLLENPPWEFFWHEALARAGTRIERDPAMVVRSVRRWTGGAYLGERYHYSRAFAATRVAGLSRVARLRHGGRAFGLPPVLFARLVRRLAGRSPGWVKVLPWLAVMTLPWAWGEAVGAWTGAGDSQARVRLG